MPTRTTRGRSPTTSAKKLLDESLAIDEAEAKLKSSFVAKDPGHASRDEGGALHPDREQDPGGRAIRAGRGHSARPVAEAATSDREHAEIGGREELSMVFRPPRSDVVTGGEIALSVFYLLPIVLVAWFFNQADSNWSRPASAGLWPGPVVRRPDCHE